MTSRSRVYPPDVPPPREDQLACKIVELAATPADADAVEVPSAQVTMSLADKGAPIKMAEGAGLKVVAEAFRRLE